MPVVKVWCLPPIMKEEQLRELHQAIVAAAVSVPEVGVIDEKTMTTLFPKDMMEYGPGTEIVIEVISGAFEARSLDASVRNRFAESMVRAVKKFFPAAMVECFILPFNREYGFFQAPAEHLGICKDCGSQLEYVGGGPEAICRVCGWRGIL